MTRRWQRAGGIVLILLAAVGILWSATVPASLSDFAAVRAAYQPSEAVLLDRNGALVQTLRQDFSRRRLAWVGLAEVSPAVAQAVLQSEDRRFLGHGGVDVRALLGAGAQDSSGGRLRGASTLSMQTAALLDLALAPRHRHRSILQKIRQIRSAWVLESTWSKAEILEAYLNLVSFRGEYEGIHTAARALFGKAPAGLTREEALVLAALLPAPAADAAAVGQRACAAARIEAPDADCRALLELAGTTLSGPHRIATEADLAPHLARRLLSHPGERRRSTLDVAVQRMVTDALSEQLSGLSDRGVRDGAAVVVDNATGDVLAYVGSPRGSPEPSEVDGVRAPRQAGSTLKPFLYGLALEDRYLTAASLLDDSPIRLETGAGLYIPQDYDRDFHGLVSVRTALAGSLNVPAVRTLVLTGPQPFLDRLQAVGYQGIDRPAEYYGYALALGSAEVTLLEQANAYRVLANGGSWSPLRLAEDDPRIAPRPVMTPEAAYIVGDILSDRGGRAETFGLDSPLTTPFWSAAKTGTSKFMRDNWCIGYTARYTVAVWVGNFNGEPMREVSGVAGAAPAWAEIIDHLSVGDPGAAPGPPPDVTVADVRFGEGIEPARREVFLRGTELTLAERAPAASLRPRLESPAAGTIVGLDPDIPVDHQQVLFRAEPRTAALRFELDGRALAGADHEFLWSPRPGPHTLTLVDRSGSEQDRVAFTVRGSPAPRSERAAAAGPGRS